jgi:dipeptidyl aminopeptidase/acylaminoacyl peptidase
MSNSKTSPFGSWVSPIDSEIVASSPQFLGTWSRQLDFDGPNLYGLEARLSEGRSVIAQYTGGIPGLGVLPKGFDARTSIYEYGGRCFCVDNGEFHFTNHKDQRIYRYAEGREPIPVTEVADNRYGDLIADPIRNRVICIREQHRPDGEPLHSIVAISQDIGGTGKLLFGESDFVAWPSINADGSKLAWIAWNHPNLPWTATALYIADIDATGDLINVQCLIPETDEVIMEPRWSPDGTLYFISDRSEWWNIYRWVDGRAECVLPRAAEFGKPFWAVGGCNYVFRSAKEIVALFVEQGAWKLGRIDLTAHTLQEIPTPYSFIARLAVRGDDCYMAATAHDLPISIVHCDLVSGAMQVVHQSAISSVDSGYLSKGQHIAFASANGRMSYGYYYPPKNSDHAGPTGALPPLLINSHGGPTGMAQSGYNMGLQFWTSRGFAVLEVNYGGSTGYGRSYRHLLRGGWGVVDVEDHIAGAKYLIAQGLVDPKACAVRGWSAGGYATLACLAFSDFFAAGADHYGISDVEQFRRETHKLEARYSDYLVGPESDVALSYARSPLQAADRIRCPMIIFQGLDDKIVPPNQSQLIVERIKQNGIPITYLEFAGEAHGFRRKETNMAVCDAELAFFRDVFEISA